MKGRVLGQKTALQRWGRSRGDHVGLICVQGTQTRAPRQGQQDMSRWCWASLCRFWVFLIKGYGDDVGEVWSSVVVLKDGWFAVIMVFWGLAVHQTFLPGRGWWFIFSEFRKDDDHEGTNNLIQEITFAYSTARELAVRGTWVRWWSRSTIMQPSCWVRPIGWDSLRSMASRCNALAGRYFLPLHSTLPPPLDPLYRTQISTNRIWCNG